MAGRPDTNHEPRTTNHKMESRLIFEKGSPGRRSASYPAAEDLTEDIPADLRREAAPALPEVGELELIRHYVQLSHKNFSIDTVFYPLGSCTMKYNPKVHERVARMPEFAGLHPLTSEDHAQPMLRLLFDMGEVLKEVTGMDGITFQPFAGAHGEFVGISVIAAHHRAQGNRKRVVLTPESAHGTNPATAAMCGYTVQPLRTDPRGMVDLSDLKAKMNGEVAAIMLTNPNTFGIFETDILEIAEVVHRGGGLLYYDGANLNALLGQCRPGDMGFDVVHMNLHKTFTTPHGGGGPGAGPVGVKAHLLPYLPVPVLVKEGDRYRLDDDRPQSIGKVSGLYGNAGMVLRAYVYARMLGAEGMRKTSEMAVLNANYVRARLLSHYEQKYKTQPMHETVLSASRQKRESGVSALDVCKRLIDCGIHPPTVYFPLPTVVPEALLIEPTETETLEQLDAFVDAMVRIAREAKESPDLLREAPHHTPVGRLDEARAARQPVLRWKRG